MAWEDFMFNGSGSGPVDPAAMQQMAAFVPGMILAVLAIVLLAVLAFALWLWMIIDCAKRKKFTNGDNVMWILLLVLTGPIGMILYYFMEVRRSGGKKSR